MPDSPLTALIYLFGYFALAYGLFSFLAAIVGRGQGASRWLLVMEGVIGLWAGIVTLRTPTARGMVLILLIWVWAIATGLLRTLAGSERRAWGALRAGVDTPP